MSRTILSRLGAGVVATALVAGGSILVAAPAMAVDDVVTPNSVVENTWGTDGGITVSGTATEGDVINVAIIEGNSLNPLPLIYINDDAETETVAGAGGAYSITFAYSEFEGEPNDFRATPELGDTPYAVIVNDAAPTAPIFVPIAVTAFAADANPTTTIVPACLTGAEAQATGVEFGSTGFGQFEENVTYSVKDAGGTVVGNSTVLVDGTGTARDAIRVFTTVNGVESGPIANGVYSITVTNGTVGSFAFFTVGDCATPVVPTVPVVPAAVVPAAPQLANTGSSDAGILVGGSALLMLVGAALVVARRRQNAAA